MAEIDLFARMVDRLLVYSSESTDLKLNGLSISPWAWDGAEPFVGMSRQDVVRTDTQGIFMDARARDLDAPLDTRLIVPTDGDIEALRFFSCVRWRHVDPKPYRGKLTMVLPNMVEWAVRQVDIATATADSMLSVWGEISPLKWVRVDRPGAFEKAKTSFRGNKWATSTDVVTIAEWNDTSVASDQINLAHGRQFTWRYQWRVYFAYEGHPGIAIPTDPIGARAAFRLRELPAGKDRREALRHWVREHARKKRADDETARVFVRRHLRGATSFRWNGLECRIAPSAFDLEMAQKLDQSAAVVG